MGELVHLLCESTEPCLDWWAHDLNDEYLYQTIRKKARKVVKWRCPDCETVFEDAVYNMTLPYGPNCPECKRKIVAERKRNREQMKRTPVTAFPQLLEAWDDERDPSQVMVVQNSPTGSHDYTVFRLRCPNGHHPRLSPFTYLQTGCPFCNSINTTTPGKGYIADEWPELATEWDEEGNGKNTPYNTRHNSKKNILWKCLACGHKWSETPKNRTNSYSACCPKCGKVLGSLGWKHPELAKEWDPMNKLSVWQVRKQLGFTPSWICLNNPSHKWQASIVSRLNGSGCPYCTDTSKSRTELMYYNAIKKVFPTAESGAVVSNPKFAHLWTVDILIDIDIKKVVIEYDGAYWHRLKTDQDMKKSLELLTAGFWVFRLRENGLPSLYISHPRYRELFVNPLSSNLGALAEEIRTVLTES